MNGNATASSSIAVSLSRRDNIHDAESESEASSAASSSKENYVDSSVILKDSLVTALYNRRCSSNNSASYQSSNHQSVREVYDPYLAQMGSSDKTHEVPLVQTTPSAYHITGTINGTGGKVSVRESKAHRKKTNGAPRVSIKEATLERQHPGAPVGDYDIFDYNDDSNSMAVELSSVDSCAVNDFKGCDISMSQQKADSSNMNTTNMMQDRSISNIFQLSSSKSFASTGESEISPDHNIHQSKLSIIATSTTPAVLSTSADNARWDIALDSPFTSAYAMNSYAMGINNNNNRDTTSTPPLSLVPAPALFIAPSTLHRDVASSSSHKGTQFMPLADATRASDWLQRSNEQQGQLIGGFGRNMGNHGAGHHGSSYHVSNTSAIDSIFGLSASNISKNSGPRDSADSDHSVATSLFVEVASLDEHGSYTRYGAACDEDPDEEATEGEQDLVRSWAQLGYDSDLTMRSYPHSVGTYQSRKQRKFGSTSNEKMSPTDVDNSHELEPATVINEEEDRLNNASNQNRKFRHRLRSIKPSPKEVMVRGKRKRRTGSNTFTTTTTTSASGGGGGGGGGVSTSNTANSTRSSKYRSMVDSELLIGVRKSVEFGPENNEQCRYIDFGGGSTSTSMDAIDVEDGYDGASERGRCEYETDYPVDYDDMGSASDNELPLGADDVIDIVPDHCEVDASLSDGLHLHSFVMSDSVYTFSINNNNNNNYQANNSNNNSNESSIRNPSSGIIVNKHAGKKRK